MESTKLQSQIVEKQKTLTDATAELEGLRQQRAQLAIDQPKAKALKDIDDQIAATNSTVQNVPDELQLLQERLEQAKAEEAQAERDALLEKQNIIAEDIERLSKDFIKALTKAKNLNEQLQTVLTVYTTLKSKTGQEVLGDYCDGSQQSLSMLLETMEAQMQGRHTAHVAAGSVGSNVPVRL